MEVFEALKTVGSSCVINQSRSYFEDTNNKDSFGNNGFRADLRVLVRARRETDMWRIAHEKLPQSELVKNNGPAGIDGFGNQD